MVPTTSGALDDLRAETAHVRQMSSRWLPTTCDLARVCMQLMLHRHCEQGDAIINQIAIIGRQTPESPMRGL